MVLPFHRLPHLAGQNIGNEEECRRSLEVVRGWIRDFFEELNLQSPRSDTNANPKAVYYRKCLEEQPGECEHIEEILKVKKEPEVK